MSDIGIFPERSANIKESGVACFALMKVGKREGTWFGLGLDAFAMKQSLQARMKYLTWESLKNKEPSIEFIVCCHHRAMQLCANAMTEEEGPIYQTMGKNNPVIQGMCTWGSGNHEYFIR